MGTKANQSRREYQNKVCELLALAGHYRRPILNRDLEAIDVGYYGGQTTAHTRDRILLDWAILDVAGVLDRQPTRHVAEYYFQKHDLIKYDAYSALAGLDVLGGQGA